GTRCRSAARLSAPRTASAAEKSLGRVARTSEVMSAPSMGRGHDRKARACAMSEDAKLFDRGLLRRRRARLAGDTSEHEFLLSHVAAEIADRIGAILRDFPLALDLGAYHGLLGRAVAALPSAGEM